VASDHLDNVYFAGYTGGSLGGPTAGQYDAIVVKISDVPEPATVVLLAVIVALAGLPRVKRARCSAQGIFARCDLPR
jgi:hypothetical protein